MEKQLEYRIKAFLCVDSGYGYGDGYGSGDGDGYGDGSGRGIPEFNGQKVWMVDNVPTVIDSVSVNFAKGSILNSDFTLTPCYIAKVENCFAHGDTLRQAFEDAKAKALRNMPTEQRIAKFREQFPDADVKIPARQLYDWHHILTGSCQMGRNQFARDHDINIDTDTFTVREFINLTCNAYGSDVVRQLAEAYGFTGTKP